jgi:DNA-binding transcriptional LysR family regulator
MIDPRRLRVLAAVASSGGISAAATSLHLTPPAVSQQLIALEREAGVSVLDRSGRTVTLTAAGRLLAEYAEKIGTLLREAERDLAELTGRATGPVRLAAFQSVMRDLVGPLLRELAASHPGIRPSVVERYGPPAVSQLRRGDLDIVLTEYDADCPAPHLEAGLGLRRLAFDPYRLVMPREWSVVARGLGDLDGRPWVAGPPDTASDHALRRLAASAGITPWIVDVCVEFPSVLALVAAGRGAAIVPAITLTEEPVTVCPVPGLGGRYLAALYRTGDGHPTPAVRTVLDLACRAPSTRGPGRIGRLSCSDAEPDGD